MKSLVFRKCWNIVTKLTRQLPKTKRKVINITTIQNIKVQQPNYIFALFSGEMLQIKPACSSFVSLDLQRDNKVFQD